MKKNLIFIFGALLVTAILAYVFVKYQNRGGSDQPKTENLGHSGPCPGETITAEMQDAYMHGLIEAGEEFQVVLNWYACHPVEIGDLVYYKLANDLPPVVKVVRARGGDHFKITKDKHRQAWNLEVNGDLVMAGEKPYFFGSAGKPTLSLYEKPREGVLGPSELIVLSNLPPGQNDSGILGLTEVDSVLGKVQLTASQERESQ